MLLRFNDSCTAQVEGGQ